MSEFKYDHKWKTLDCETCPCRIEDVCYWGNGPKHLSTGYPGGTVHKMKHCEYVDKAPMRDMSYWTNSNKSVHPGENPISIPIIEQGKLL